MSTNSDNQAVETSRQRAYVFKGTLSEVASKVDRTGKPYLTAKFTAKIGGDVKTVRTMAFGKAVESVKATWNDGEAMLYGLIEKASGESKGGVLRAIAPGRTAAAG